MTPSPRPWKGSNVAMISLNVRFRCCVSEASFAGEQYKTRSNRSLYKNLNMPNDTAVEFYFCVDSLADLMKNWKLLRTEITFMFYLDSAYQKIKKNNLTFSTVF